MAKKLILPGIVKVKNLDHEADENSDYIGDWEKIKRRKATHCANLNCSNKESDLKLVGGHVIKAARDAGKEWYITPLCHVCNANTNTEPMDVLVRDLAKYTDIIEES